MEGKENYKTNDFNPIIKHVFTADPAVIEHNGRIYLYTGHDEAEENQAEYVMRDWLCFSSADLVNWQQHEHVLKVTDFNWAKGDAYASAVIYANGRFYRYLAVSHGSIAGKAIAVAVADAPEGRFSDAIGKALINQNMIPDNHLEMVNLDPSVIIDSDGRPYIFWGNSICYYAALAADMCSLDGEIHTLNIPGFAEGVHLHKKGEWYYLSYGYQSPERVAYCISKSIHGPWVFKGILNEVPGNCQTNRPAIIDFKGRTFFFYHNGALTAGGSYRRSVCVDELFYENDGTMRKVQMSSEGPGGL